MKEKKNSKSLNLLIRSEALGEQKTRQEKKAIKFAHGKKNWAFIHKKPIIDSNLKVLGHEIELKYFGEKG